MTPARPNYLRDGSPLLLQQLTGFKMKSRRTGVCQILNTRSSIIIPSRYTAPHVPVKTPLADGW